MAHVSADGKVMRAALPKPVFVAECKISTAKDLGCLSLRVQQRHGIVLRVSAVDQEGRLRLHEACPLVTRKRMVESVSMWVFPNATGLEVGKSLPERWAETIQTDVTPMKARSVAERVRRSSISL